MSVMYTKSTLICLLTTQMDCSKLLGFYMCVCLPSIWYVWKNWNRVNKKKHTIIARTYTTKSINQNVKRKQQQQQPQPRRQWQQIANRKVAAATAFYAFCINLYTWSSSDGIVCVCVCNKRVCFCHVLCATSRSFHFTIHYLLPIALRCACSV